ncbi:DUF1573 domain-containing protein [Sediminibacterium soli]|uniref:DUF1573 domain-containing protein n=1 Tax=Sediminibacterium soli TaxID=2698829 RepID=UPI00137ACC4C|nr:DUF1573 domain-containing protein [Sediminibacterium soli]NCI47239.1 DUF1573 domain-containing protein [Sediminibacterium soli]
MKKLFVVAALFLGVNLFAQNASDIVFKETKHDFGKIKHRVPATYTFAYTNNASKPAIIEVATAECGCTKPEYSVAPLAKGKTGTIKVTYNAENFGMFNKKVTVKFANVAEPVTLTINGDVLTPKTK